MNAFLKKEIRLLLPSWILGLGATFLVFFYQNDPNYHSGFRMLVNAAPMFLIPAMVLMMALDSFGRELSAATFSNLLTQPISRRRIWRTKTFLLAAAILIIWLTLWCALLGNKNIVFKPEEFRYVFLTTVLFAVSLGSGGLWTTLLLRQVAAAFWFTLLVPAILLVPILSLQEKYPASTVPALVIVLSLYSVAGFLFARRLFLRAQDVQWTGGIIALPEFRRWGKSESVLLTKRIWRPRTALFVKEFQLHQSQFVMAGVLALFHLGVIFLRKFIGTFGSAGVEFIYQNFWVLWFVMPLLVGCAAVAEERKLGTLESQLCLPVRRRTQFFVKFFSTILFSIVLSQAMPLLLEGFRIVPDIEWKFAEELAKYDPELPNAEQILGLAKVLQFMRPLLPLLVPLGIAAVIAVVSFYASTMARNTLQSLAPAVLGIFVTFTLLVSASEVERLFPFPLWRGGLIYLIGVPAMTVMIFLLMYWNFKRVWIDGKVLRRNGFVFVGSLAFVIGITTAIFHRAWEFLSPLEPAHGPARLRSTDSVTLQNLGQAITIQLPDGKIWSAIFEPSAPNLMTMLSGNWKMKPLFGGGKFLEATNWASVALSYQGMFGVQNDGSLWASEKPRERSTPETPALVRLGADNDWKAVSGHFPWAFFLKRDGTLWRLNRKSWLRKTPWPGIQAFEMQRLGTNSDWAEISQIEWRTAFRKEDGQTWVQGAASETNSVKLDEDIFISRAERLDGLKSSAWFWSQFGDPGRFQIAVGQNGKLLLASDLRVGTQRFDLAQPRIQLGDESNWLTVTGGGETLITLKSDGSLWKWSFTDDPVAKPDSAVAVRFGKHSDWIAIADEFGGVTSLAADGSLWFWQFDSRYFSRGDEMIPPLLSASRKPQLIGNVFDAPRVP